MKLTSALVSLSLCVPSSVAFLASRRAFLSAAAVSGSLAPSNGKASHSPRFESTTVRHMSQSSQEFIESQINFNKVTVFSKTYCPYCSSTKALFDNMNVDYTAIELDTRDDGAAIQQALLDKTGQRTVPNTFIGKEWVGGNDKVQAAAKAGKLQSMLGIQ
jgi:glutaredoxin 3